MITAAQLIAARGLLGWSQSDLARASGVGLSTIKRMEQSDGPLRGIAANVWKVQAAVGRAGILFIDEDDQAGPGVRLEKR